MMRFYDYISLFVLLNLISVNLIILNDIYFEMKNVKYRINFTTMPKFYPSYTNFLNTLFNINTICILYGITKICYNFWLNDFQDFETFNKSTEYVITLISVIIITNILVILFLLVLTYYSIKIISYSMNIIKSIMFNYINEKPLFLNINKETEHNYCWICDKYLNKFKVVKKLNCPCQENFHPDCIDKYLVIYNNYCRAGHKIAKYEHTV